MINLQDISKVFTTREVETRALTNINLTIDKGEFVSVMGPSGCGKTTLLNIMGLIETPSSGTYYFDNRIVSSLSERQRTDIRKESFSYVFQSFNLIDELTVRENIELPLIYQKIHSTERKKRVDNLLDRFNLGHRSDYFPQQLSGGQQQRVAVARAIVSRPRIILADEPTGNLDSTHGEEIMRLLTSLNEEGTTIVMVTHSKMHAQRAQRIIHLFDGHVVTENFTMPTGI
ncbi:ABC transporter ATP-binding protein [Prolixibacter denitrificans]|uniref:ABC transporter ATP-binding protein n=1 Tax=Prolixibacter denitrificans TaxID=1541063 RepID=A0A2P8C8K1_9BACT|nr:ABC transporter ATP-binding protein [Prolixibacter denitrificans]PSK81294.1 putative ABC transport system ATP-binding protein [Prolixibacter denitrificans]GET21621.1 ABC transporter ATP-binding protein [Prolixibacter denitrificans]